jgi:hypothetical protein
VTGVALLVSAPCPRLRLRELFSREEEAGTVLEPEPRALLGNVEALDDEDLAVNVDDHLKNCWMLALPGGFRLAPAFDLVPDISGRGEHPLSFQQG